MSTQSLSITTCLSCIAANRLVLSLRGLYYMHDTGDTTIAATNSKSVNALGRFKELSSIFAVVSRLDTVVAVEEDNRREESV